MRLVNFIGAVVSKLRQPTESKAKIRSGQNHVSRFRVEQAATADTAQRRSPTQPDPSASSQDQNETAIVLFQDQPAGENTTIDLTAWESQPTTASPTATDDQGLKPETRNPKPETIASEAVRPLVNQAVDQLSNLGFSAEQLDRARQVEDKRLSISPAGHWPRPVTME